MVGATAGDRNKKGFPWSEIKIRESIDILINRIKPESIIWVHIAQFADAEILLKMLYFYQTYMYIGI